MSELFDHRSVGQFYVPLDVVHFMVDLTEPQPGDRILGIGFEPNRFKTYVQKKVGEQPDCIRPELSEIEDLALSYDTIVCGPPFGERFEQEASEEFWLKWCVAHLARDGRLSIVVPAGLLSNYSQKDVRRFLLDEASLHLVVELASGWARASTVQASVLLVQGKGQQIPHVRMWRLTSPDSVKWDELARVLRTDEPDVSTIPDAQFYSIHSQSLTSERLDFTYYEPKYTEIEPPDPEIFEAVKLGQLAEIRSGMRIEKEKFVAHGVPFVQVGNIKDGRLLLSSARQVAPEVVLSRALCQVGDVLITIAGSVGKVALVDDTVPSPGVCIDTSIRRLRVDDAMVLPEYLAMFLRSRYAQLQIERLGSGSVIRVLSSPFLEKMEVYLPDFATQRELVQLTRDLEDRLGSQVLAAFPEEEKLVAIANRLSAKPPKEDGQLPLSIVMHEPPSPSKILLEQFPHPIAHAYAAYERSKTESPYDQFKALLDLSESCVFYLYGVLVADYLKRLMWADPGLNKFIVTDFSIDRRLSFIQELLKVARQRPDQPLFVPELLRCEWSISRQVNNNLRNPTAHVKKRTDRWFQASVTEYEPKVLRLLESLSPLTGYTLATVTDITYRNGTFQHTISAMMGQAPYFQKRVEEIDPPLRAEEGHVVLMDQNYEILDLRPFYVLHGWEETAYEEHLCYFKQTVGEGAKTRLKVESTRAAVDTETNSDLGLLHLLSDLRN